MCISEIELVDSEHRSCTVVPQRLDSNLLYSGVEIVQE